MSNNNNSQHHNGGFANGFLFGLVVGAALVFLLATKKGRRILKLISEEGFDNLADIVDEYTREDEEEIEIDQTKNGELKQEAAVKKAKKRFFRRAK